MMKKMVLIYASICLATSCITQESSTFKDSRDGTIYKYVTIGRQTWMAENLRYKTIDGCFVPDSIPEYKKMYGMYYNFEAAKKACPVGWHLPSDNEWMELCIVLGGRNFAGEKLKAKSAWAKVDKPSTNSSGFSALPGGFRDLYGMSSMEQIANFWSSTLNIVGDVYIWAIEYKGPELGRGTYQTPSGLNVRCVKDEH